MVEMSARLPALRGEPAEAAANGRSREISRRIVSGARIILAPFFQHSQTENAGPAARYTLRHSPMELFTTTNLHHDHRFYGFMARYLRDLYR